jgi:MPBQ/MSBQ methyltransferase
MASISNKAGASSSSASARPAAGAPSSPVKRRSPVAASAGAGAGTAAPTASPGPRFIQDKAAAKTFYRFLSIGYDWINQGHWTTDMRDAALEPADLRPGQKVCDVGGGTGFCTLGVVGAGVLPADITLLDQSPHQLAKAKAKPLLNGVTIVEGDAENLPFPTDSYDRYTSAGSIEYWPNPQQGICEAYRVLKPGGVACMIGPVHPTHPVSRFFADAWMLFPKEEEYLQWFGKAGFEDVKITRIGPKWYRGVRRHGLIMGCSVTGTKRRAGESPGAAARAGSAAAAAAGSSGSKGPDLVRLVLGTLAGFYYFCLPIYMYIKNMVVPEGKPL